MTCAFVAADPTCTCPSPPPMLKLTRHLTKLHTL